MFVKDLTKQYRPNDWSSIVGQDHLVKTLQNEIKNDTIGHAYLFCGPRGTGKTTTARVFAKSINAQIIELDAASNNGVENIRSLKDDVLFLPTDGSKYKVYIIDEVHMLSTGAFNAFLKTLEEPPAHVIFVLATTDPQKIPNTILSRCQRFDLKRITVSDIVNRLSYICEEENIQLDPDNAQEVLEYIAKSVDGGMRDAIKLLQKCTSLDEVITVQTVIDALGSVNVEHLENMTKYLLNRDIKNVLTYFNQLVMDGIDVKIFLADLVDYIKESMKEDIVNNNFSINNRMLLAEELLALLASLRNATQVKTITEIAFIKMCLQLKSQESVVNKESEAETAKTAAQQRKEVNEQIQAIPADPELLQQLVDKLTNLEKRMVVTEMQVDSLRFRR